MNDRAKQELDKIVSVLAATGVVSQIYLFGSYARGEETPDSDMDICVLTTEKDKHPIEQSGEFRIKLRGVKTMPLDLLSYEQDFFNFHAKRPTSFEHLIAQEGILLYEHGKS